MEDMSHHFGHGLKSNVRSPSHVLRGVKAEMVDVYQSGHFELKLESPRDVLNGADGLGMCGMCDCKWRHHHHHQSLSPEAEAGAWLRDEPVDIIPASNGGLLGSWSASTVGRDVGIGEGSMEMCGSPLLSDVPAFGSPGCTSEPLEDVSHMKGGLSHLFAQLRATKIRESVMREAIQRLGGGQKGLRAVIKVIGVWLREKNRYAQSSDQRAPQSDITEEIDHILWHNAGQGSTMDVPYGSFASSAVSSGLQGDVNYSMNSMAGLRDSSGSICELRMGGSGDYGEVHNYENQPRIFVGESGNGMCIRSQGSGVHSTDTSPMSSGCWVPSPLSADGLQCGRVRKVSPSPDPTLLLRTAPDISVYEDCHSHKNKIRRLSPPRTCNSSSQSSNELPSYGGVGSPPVSDVLGAPSIFGANPFAPGGPFSMSPSSSPAMDPHSLDAGPFTSFGLQNSMLMDESLQGCGLIDRLGSLGPLYPGSPENSSLDRLKTAAANTKASPAASTRLARKNRMDRNRKSGSHHASRASPQAGASAVAGSPGLTWPLSSSSSLRSRPHSQEISSSEAQHSVKSRRDKEQLQFLLQKVLRPSDVGNLGRIVLPKKDAESHLPWLAAREGVQFNCEDYDTGDKMVLRYRFWPNNKSRMYLLENTGEFVKKHQLQESDRLLVYRNQQQGTYIIRGRKARDCHDTLPNQVQSDEADRSQQNSPEGTCCSGASSVDKDAETSESIAVSRPSSGTVTSIVTQAVDLLNFADLPDAPMGAGAENLVRFPSLESFDVEMLELVPKEEDGKACEFVSRAR